MYKTCLRLFINCYHDFTNTLHYFFAVSAGMAPLTQEERRATRAQQAVVQGVAHSEPRQDEHIGSSNACPKTSSKRRRPNTSM